MKQIKAADFKEIKMHGALVPYYSTRLENGDEICIEPNVDQTFYVARYDKEKMLIGEKLKTKSNYSPKSIPEAIDLANKLL